MPPLFGRHRQARIAPVLLLVACQCAFAGKEFLAGPHEQVVPNQLLVGLQLGADIQQILNAILPQAAASIIGKQQNTYLITLPPGIQALASKLLAAHPQVNYVEPNRVRSTAVLPPNDPKISQQWALTNIQAAGAWSYFPDHYLTAATAGSNRVKVAIIDTGADCTHPDFMNTGGASTDAAQGGQFLWAASVAFVATTVTSPACPWADDNGHGTHTSGILAAATDNATGVASLGYPLELIVYKTQDATGEGSDYYIAQAIYDAIGAGAQVISMSLGGEGYSQTMQTAINSAWQNNVLVVAAAGNAGGNVLTYPADANFAMAVAATDNTNTVAAWSNYGNWVRIAAPGVSVLSDYPNASYAIMSGTSMATPHVAALAGLIFASNPGISAAAVAQRIQQTAQSPNTGWNQYIGYGVIDATAALSGVAGPFTQGSITGQVTDTLGNPINGATVTAGSQSFTTAADPTTGDTNGLFRLLLSPGSYTVGVTQSSYSPVDVQAVAVAGADTMLNIQMGVTYGEFTGSVTHNGAAVPGAVVEAVSGGLILGTALTNSSGAYTLYVPAGTYTLTASAADYINSTSASQNLSANGAVNVNLFLSAQGTIAGTVTDINGIPVPNAHIDFTNGGFTGGAFTGAAGTYATYGLPAGTYTVTASASGYTSVTTGSVSVNTNVSTLVNFQFSTGVSLSSGLTGYWPFNEGTGTVAHDLSGNGYNAALTNTTWTGGPLGAAANFNGSNSLAVTPNIPFGSAFSASVWVNPATASQGEWAGIVQPVSGSGFFLGTDSTGTMYKLVLNSGAGATGSCGYLQGCAQGGTIASGWHLLTGAYDGITAILYIDGVAIANDTFTAPSAVTVPMDIGASWSTGSVWNGALYGVRLYNRALTASEVSSLFNQATALSLTKTADAVTVAAGSSIGYTLSVLNSGAGAAASAALSDVLPTGTGIGWTISPAYNGPGNCVIANGSLSCSFGSLGAGGTASVHIASATTASSCGAYTNTASATASNASSVQASATTAVQCSQTIEFGALPNVAFGTPPFTVSAASTSGLAVSFSSQTTAVCTVSGATVTIVSAGLCTIQATQAGDAIYTAAPSVNRSFTVTQESQTIGFGALANKVYGSAPFTVSATATSGLAVSFNSQTTPVCTVSGSTVTIVSAGTCTVQATQAGNTNFSAAPSVNQSFTVTPASQSISFSALANQVYGTTPFNVSATASSGLAVSFNSQTSTVCTVSGPAVTLLATGACTVQATQAGNSSYSAAPAVNQNFTVTPASQTISFAALSNQGLGTAPFALSATSSSGLTVSFASLTTTVCTVSGATVTLAATGTCTVQATQAGNGNYSAAASVNRSFLVTAGTAAIGAGALNFANTIVGKSSATQTFTAQNSGNAPLTIASIAVSGSDSGNYQYTPDAVHPCPISPATLAAAASCTLDMVFAPVSQGSHNNAQVAIVDNSGNVPGSMQTVALTGTGIVLASIGIGANSGSIASGGSEQFTATGTYSDNSTASLTSQVTWSSSAPAVASVSASGMAAGLSAGQTNISAALSGVTSNSFALTVSAGTAASISVAGGMGQSTTVGTAFTGLLQSLVKDSGGNAVANASVTFTAPGSGASGTFANGLATYTTATNASGVATALTFSANSTAGAYSVTAGVAGVLAAASFSLTNTAPPALTISEIPAGTLIQGQNAVYNVTVANGPNGGPTSGPITVTDTVPPGLTLVGLNGGSTWNCSLATAACTTNTVLNPGASSSIVVTLSVPFNGPSSVSNGISLSGGGSVTLAASNPTAILSACAVTLDSNPSVADVQAIVNQALGIGAPANDLNGDGTVNVVDLQIVTNAALGQSCSASQDY